LRAERDSELGSWIGPELDATPDLFSQGAHQLHSERFSLAKIQRRGKTYAVVSDEQLNLVGFTTVYLDSDFSASTSGKSILERVRDKFVDDETKWDGEVNAERDIFYFGFKRNPRGFRAVRSNE
jgi:hypothetical protein